MGSLPGPSRGTSTTTPISRAARTAGTIVSNGESSGPTPRKATTPITATATKLTLLLIRKKATDRRAMCSLLIPPSCRTQAPSARPPRPLAGTIEPMASSEPAICQERRRDIPRQKIGANMST